MYADFVPFFATVEDGTAVIAAPAGQGRTGFVSRNDLADVAGELSAVTDVVPSLTGSPARSVAEHLRAHPEDWVHLRGTEPSV